MFNPKIPFFMSFLTIPFAPADEGAGGAGDEGAGGAEDEGAGGAGAGGAGDESPYNWLGDDEFVTADVKTYLDAKSFKTPQDLYKSLRGAEKMIRGDQISGPPEDAEKHAEWMKESGLAKRLGIPDEATGYGIEVPKFEGDLGGMINYGDERHGKLLAAAHGLNMTPAQVEGMLGFYAEEMTEDAKGMLAEGVNDEAEMKTTLTQKWGKNYDVNVQAALEIATESGLDEAAVEALRHGKIIGSTALTSLLHEVALARGNDTLKGGGGGDNGASKEEAVTALSEFSSKNVKALTDAGHPEHEAAFARLQVLKKAAGRGS